MDHADLDHLHDYARAIARIEDELITAVSEIQQLAAHLMVRINDDIADAKQEDLEDADKREPRHCRTCGAELTTADTGFTDCHTCAWTESQKKRKEGTQP